MSTISEYGLLDAAADERIYGHMAALEPFGAQCLFDGKLDIRLRKALPFLFSLDHGDDIASLWFSEGWNRNWGLLIRSDLTLPRLRKKLHEFAETKLTTGEGPLLFRFWDPRVFRHHMSTIHHDQLQRWFDGIKLFTSVSIDGIGSLKYELEQSNLKVSKAARPGLN